MRMTINLHFLKKIPSLRINPQIMDISHVGSLDQDHCSMFEVPVVNLRRNYVDSNNFIHQKLTVKPATNNPTVIVSTAQKLCCCDGVAHAVGENCTDERYQCDYEYQVEIWLILYGGTHDKLMDLDLCKITTTKIKLTLEKLFKISFVKGRKIYKKKFNLKLLEIIGISE